RGRRRAPRQADPPAVRPPEPGARRGHRVGRAADLGLDPPAHLAQGARLPRAPLPGPRGDGDPGLQPFHLFHLLMTTPNAIPEPERERIAKIEIGQTDVSKSLCWALVLLFLAVIASVPLLDLLSGRVRETGVTASTLSGVVPVARQQGWIAGA